MQTLAPVWQFGNTATAKWYVRLLPSLNDLAFLLPMLLLFARFDGTDLLFADGDTGWHIRTGQWILAHGRVPVVDLFSFTKAGQPWFAWEWGWDLVFALIHQASGLAGVAFAASLMLGMFSLLLYRVSLRLSGNHLTSITATALAAGASSIHWLARPHLVSWIFALLFLDILIMAQRSSFTYLWLLPALMLFWTNLHGGFIAGLLILACYALGEFLSSLVQQSDLRTAWEASRSYCYCLGGCALATLINPYGWGLHRHVYAYLTDTGLLDKIQEFQSISFHAGPAWLFELTLLLGAFAVFRKLRQLDFTPVLLLCLWAHYALYSARHIPLLMIVAAPYIAELLAVALAQARRLTALFPAADAMQGMAQDFRDMEIQPRLYATSAAAVLLLAALFAVGNEPFAARFNPKNFPVEVMPLLARHPASRIFTTDQWGDYLLYRLYPGQRVFFDGRSDFYGAEFIKLNQDIASAAHGWQTRLRDYSIGLVVLKPDVPLVAALKLTAGAKVLFDDGQVIVFDLTATYPPVQGRRNPATTAVSAALTPQAASPAIAFTVRRTTQSTKGKLS